MSPTPEEGDADDDDDMEDGKQKEEELNKLKAKLELKKKMLAERKKKKEIEAAAAANTPAAAPATEQQPSTQFTPSSTSSSHLPPDLQQRYKEVEEKLAAKRAALTAGIEDDIPEDDTLRTNNTPANPTKSLSGTCTSMCPDEEIIQRDMEGDIQLLEIPHAAIHSKGATLRDTAVKRFRRSAADFKLDIPELVRPPFVLEICCGYLEESVMVSF